VPGVEGGVAVGGRSTWSLWKLSKPGGANNTRDTKRIAASATYILAVAAALFRIAWMDPGVGGGVEELCGRSGKAGAGRCKRCWWTGGATGSSDFFYTRRKAGGTVRSRVLTVAAVLIAAW
jgi:hypothetical protein